MLVAIVDDVLVVIAMIDDWDVAVRQQKLKPLLLTANGEDFTIIITLSDLRYSKLFLNELIHALKALLAW